MIVGAGCDHRVQGERGHRDGAGACRGGTHHVEDFNIHSLLTESNINNVSERIIRDEPAPHYKLHKGSEVPRVGS